MSKLRLLLATLALFLTVGLASAQEQNDPIYYPEEWLQGGPAVVNSEYVLANYQMAFVLNINDGTSTIYRLHPDGTQEVLFTAYAVVGRLLNLNPELTSRFEQSRWYADGYLYDGNVGMLWYPPDPETGIRAPRTTLTPLIIGDLYTFYTQNGFGGLEGFSRIGVIKALIKDGVGGVTTEDLNSDTTIHRVPQESGDQEILLRLPGLIAANTGGHPIPDVAGRNRSTGCVNYDRETWILMESLMQTELDAGRRVAVIFTVPGLPQDILIRSQFRYSLDPLAHINVNGGDRSWVNMDDVRDRRGYVGPLDPAYPVYQ